MTLIPQFPGMNPYLESPHRWPEIHHQLISEIAATLNSQVVPKYRAAVETRVYIDFSLVGIPDVFVAKKSEQPGIQSTSVAVFTKPERVTIPSPCEVKEGYIEIRETATRRVITIIELLSPANKRSGEGRRQYLKKRHAILESETHFVEIDLLRKGDPMPLIEGQETDYQVLVSRVDERPVAERYAFGVQDSMPKFPLPLQTEDTEPCIDLKALLSQVCRKTAIDIVIDYQTQPQPALSSSDFSWLKSLPTADVTQGYKQADF